MKKLKKVHIVNTRQQEHIMNEKSIMLDCHCDFIARFTIISAINNYYQSSLLFLPRDALQCKAQSCDRMSSVRPSVSLSVCDVGGLRSHSYVGSIGN